MKINIKNKLKLRVNKILIEKVARFRNLFRSRKYRNKYKKLISGKVLLKDIEVISIEFCSICNLSCRYCHLTKGQRPSFLDFNIYKKLLIEICENKEYMVKIMEWPISGCFFLHPQYREIIEITKECIKKYPNFRPWIILNDNMMLFDKDTVDFVLKQGVVKQIICSIDGVDKESFEYMRPNANFETVLKNTSYFLRKNNEYKKRLMTQINNGRDEKCIGRKIDLKLMDIFNQADYFTCWEPRNWNESFHNDQPCYSPYPYFCSFVFESVCLSASGAIIKCCMDLKEATKYGDFATNTLKSIWFSKERRVFLKKMHEGRRRLITGCEFCSISYVRQNKFPQ